MSTHKTGAIGSRQQRLKPDVQCPARQTPRRRSSSKRETGGCVPWRILHGDCLQLLADLPSCSVDAVVCDPPYGINFKGRHWDGRSIRESAALTTGRTRLTANEAFQEWTRSWALECLRVLKPGGHLLAFGSPRTFHRLASGLEDAGLLMRDTLMWLYGTGVPKSRRQPDGRTAQLKPAWEPILLARAPLDGTLEHNLTQYGTGVLNTNTCRVAGSFPANVLLTHSQQCADEDCIDSCAVATVDASADATGHARSAQRKPVSRLFYCAKVSRAERDAGCEHLPARELNLFPQADGYQPPLAHNPHRTVKPIALMRWLVRLACPSGGTVLDPFCGAGSTGAAALLEGCQFIGIEREAKYVQIAEARVAHWSAMRHTNDRRQACRPLVATPRRTR